MILGTSSGVGAVGGPQKAQAEPTPGCMAVTAAMGMGVTLDRLKSTAARDTARAGVRDQ